MWNAPATGSGITRTPAGGFAASCGERVDGAGGDDLPAAVDVGAHQVQLFQRGQHGVGVAAHQGGHPGRGQGAGRAHRAAADRGQVDGVQGGQDPGERGRGQFADRVSGDDGAGRNGAAVWAASSAVATTSGWVTAVSLISSAPAVVPSRTRSR